MLVPISCAPRTKIPKAFLKSYPFIPVMNDIIIDNFADDLIRNIEENKRFGGLDT